MIHADMLRKLSVGQVLETVPMFEAVTEEPVCFKVERTDAHDPNREIAPAFLVEFSVWYYELPIGSWVVKVEESGEMIWIDLDATKKGRVIH
jgi:hypothetical protein